MIYLHQGRPIRRWENCATTFPRSNLWPWLPLLRPAWQMISPRFWASPALNGNEITDMQCLYHWTVFIFKIFKIQRFLWSAKLALHRHIERDPSQNDGSHYPHGADRFPQPERNNLLPIAGGLRNHGSRAHQKQHFRPSVPRGFGRSCSECHSSRLVVWKHQGNFKASSSPCSFKNVIKLMSFHQFRWFAQQSPLEWASTSLVWCFIYQSKHVLDLIIVFSRQMCDSSSTVQCPNPSKGTFKNVAGLVATEKTLIATRSTPILTLFDGAFLWRVGFQLAPVRTNRGNINFLKKPMQETLQSTEFNEPMFTQWRRTATTNLSAEDDSY